MKTSHGRIVRTTFMTDRMKTLKWTLKTLSVSEHIKGGRTARIDCSLQLLSF